MASWFVDNAAGNDANAGTSTSAPFRHCPGGSDFTGTCTLQPGDFVYFKRGVTYAGGQITCGQSGSVIANHADGAITAAGVFTSATGGFIAAGVNAGTDWVYIYHNKESVTGTWVETTGLYAIASVDSATQLTLASSPARAWTTAELPYFIIRPITYKAAVGWGSGEATLTGGGTLSVIMSSGDKNCIRVDGLTFTNTLSSTYYYRGALCHLSAGSSHFHIANCAFTNCGDSGAYMGGDYVVATNNTATNCAAFGVRTVGISSLFEHNTVTGGTRSGADGMRFSVIRYSTLTDIVGSYGGFHGDSIGEINGGATGNVDYGWIYGNKIKGYIEAIPLYYASGDGLGGPESWVVHSNLIICTYSTSGHGDAALMLNGLKYNHFYNNTLVGLNGTVFGATGTAFAVFEDRTPDSQNCVLKNNIVAGSVGGAMRFDSTEHTGTVCQRNHYYLSGETTPFMYDGAAKTLAQWQALGYDTTGIHATHGLSTNPGFTDIATEDFSLSASSPDLNAGEDLSAYFTLDKNGVSRVGKWSLGAIESADSPETSGHLVFAIGGDSLALAVSV